MRTVACSIPYVPVEWIAAHGLRPQRLCLHSEGTRSTAAGLRGVCPFAGALVDVVRNGLEADALVVATTCDQMRRAITLAEREAHLPLFALHVPATWQTPAVRTYFGEQLDRLSRFLVQLGGMAPTDGQLAQAIVDFCTEDASSDARGRTADGVPLALIGGPLLASDRVLYDWIEQAGGRVVLDATEGGRRTRPSWPDPDRLRSEPREALIDAYFLGIPDAFRRPNDLLYQWLGRTLAACQVRGIVFHRYLWCDIWHGELHRLKAWSPVPVLDLDAGDEQMGTQGRALGRLEAFLEVLR